jgi:hypothetical protein
LKWKSDLGCWTAEVALPAWRDFLAPMPAFARRGKPRKSNGTIRLEVLTPEGERVDPLAEQWRAYQYIVENGESVRDAVLRAVMKQYARFAANVELYPGKPDWLESQSLPKKIAKPAELQSRIQLTTLFIHHVSRSGISYVGFGFECVWDVEHGLGVMTHRRRIVGTGDEEVAFSSYLCDEELRQLRKRLGIFKVPEKLNAIDINTAVLDGNMPWVKALLKAGASPEKRYHGAGTNNAIEMAAYGGEAAMLKLLMKGVKRLPNQQVLRAAIYRGDTKVKKILIAHGMKEK